MTIETPPSSDRCPTCKGKINLKAVRICFECQKPIIAHHKFTLKNITLPDGRIATAYAHRHCDAPYDYVGKNHGATK